MGVFVDSLSGFVAGLNSHDVPDEAFAICGVGFCDVMGVSIAAFDQPIFRQLQTVINAQESKPESRILLTEERTLAPEAALIGAATAHALDYDDYAFSNHVSAVLVPAILAEAETTGASGIEMAAAYIAGYEVWREIMKREPDDWYSRGWHPTAILGAFGSTAASAHLRGLNSDQIRNAFGLCFVQSTGVMGNFGSMGKPYQGAAAARAGLVATRMAEAGIDAGPDSVDGANGFLRALSPSGEIDVETPAARIGREWGILTERLNIKRYPTVGASQRCIDCAIQLHEDFAPDPERISLIRPHISERHSNVMPYRAPQTALEAKFSLEFVVAAGLVDGAVTFNQMTDAYVQRPDIQRLMALVEREIGPDDDPVYPAGKRADIVEVGLDDGSVLTSNEVERWRGHGANPMSRQELRAKFMDCASRGTSESQAAGYFDALIDIASLGSMQDIPVLTPLRQA